MTLVKLLNSMSPWLTVFILFIAAEIYSVGLMLASRAIWGIDRLRLNNEVAGFKFAVVGVLYAVLLAFVVIAVWQQYTDTESAVRNEAKALVDLQQLSHALPEPAGSSIRQHLNDYIADVRKSEWASMGDGLASPSAEAHLQRLSKAIFEGSPNELKDVAKFQHALELLRTVNDNRSDRLDGADGSIPGVLWLVLVGGGLITLGYPSFFGSSNVAAQALMTASLAALVAMTLLVCLMLDFPFTGQVGISAAPFEKALAQMSPEWPPAP